MRAIKDVVTIKTLFENMLWTERRDTAIDWPTEFTVNGLIPMSIKI